jgi:hypothetical protein
MDIFCFPHQYYKVLRYPMAPNIYHLLIPDNHIPIIYRIFI